jgi:hypothetical protein
MPGDVLVVMIWEVLQASKRWRPCCCWPSDKALHSLHDNHLAQNASGADVENPTLGYRQFYMAGELTHKVVVWDHTTFPVFLISKLRLSKHGSRDLDLCMSKPTCALLPLSLYSQSPCEGRRMLGCGVLIGSGGSRLEAAGRKVAIYSQLCSGSNFLILKDL